MHRRLAPLLLALLVAVVATGCGGDDGQAACERLPGVRNGLCLTPPDQREPAPVDAVEVLGSDDDLSVRDLRGQVVVLNFWASWCGPCRAEQPDLNAAADLLADRDVTFLGVNIGQDSPVNAQAHVREFAIPYASVHDPASAFAARFGGVGPRAIPTTILLDRQGRVAARIFGVVAGPQEVVTLVDRLLA